MTRNLLVSLFFVGLSATISAQLKIEKMLTENRSDLLGSDVQSPRFTWVMSSEVRDQKQTAYQLKVSTTADMNSEVWNSGKIESDSSVQVAYKGQALQPNTTYFWSVQVWDGKGRTIQSEPAKWHTGIFDQSFWKASWIGPAYKEDSVQAAPLLRKAFNNGKKVTSAYAYITSHGMYEARINGKKIGDSFLTPGWTSYSKRLQYQVYDVSSMIADGNNTIGVILANGWYRGAIGFLNNRDVYGKDVALLFQLEILYTDGTRERVISDNSWRSASGEYATAEIYNGDSIDFRKQQAGWDLNGFDDSKWMVVKPYTFGYSNLVATVNEPVRKHEVFKPIKFITTPKGEKVIDFGQNLVGWVRFKAKGINGSQLIVSHAEVLDKEGNFYTANLRAARSQAIYIIDGKERVLEPNFTFHGFRYARIEGFEGKLEDGEFEAITLYSDMEKAGTFTSSDTLINQLQKNITWGQKGNFLDVPTDCPQRDERLGWTGDAQVFARTAAFNMNVNNFFAKWLRDVAADQDSDGSVPMIIPNIFKFTSVSAGWADVSTIIPWNMYQVYGDKRILETQYPSMKAWVEYIHKQSVNDLWNNGSHFGDWLFYSLEDDTEGRSAITDKHLIAQCFYAHSTQLLINSAQVLGKMEDVKIYTELLTKIKSAFMKEYVTPNGRLVSGSQTAYVLALNFDMLPENLRQQAVDRLVQNIESYDNHLTTGFLGTPYLCHVLSRFGRSDKAYTLLLQKSYPSWLYPVTKGATTIWERWNGIKTDGSFENVGMNSFNHYAYGAIGDWMYRTMVGLNTDDTKPGYKHSIIKPVIGGGFTSAKGSLETYYGTLANGWKIINKSLTMNIEIPVNTTASVYVPVKSETLKLNGRAAIGTRIENGYVVLELGSGKYEFTGKVSED